VTIDCARGDVRAVADRLSRQPAESNNARGNPPGRNALLTFEDVHCSVFAAQRLNFLMNDLTAMSLLRFRMKALRPMLRRYPDFSVTLRRI
jgi:hypothetical protein